jgi:hypothetical protein
MDHVVAVDGVVAVVLVDLRGRTQIVKAVWCHTKVCFSVQVLPELDV